MSDEESSANDDTVGYGKPPKSGQFKPGQSGNPSGKKKGKSLLQCIAEVGDSEKTFLQAGKQVTMPANAALAEKLFGDALKGKPQAAKLVLDAQKSVFGDSGQGEGVLAGPEERDVALTHVEWLKLTAEVFGGANNDEATS